MRKRQIWHQFKFELGLMQNVENFLTNKKKCIVFFYDSNLSIQFFINLKLKKNKKKTWIRIRNDKNIEIIIRKKENIRVNISLL